MSETKVLTLSTCQWIRRLNGQIIDLNNRVDTKGNTTYAGEAAPQSSLGVKGDIYIQLDCGVIYSKGSTNWDIIGPMSIDGGTF